MGRVKVAPKGTRICENHFTADQFERYCIKGRKQLKPDAVPTIFSCMPSQPLENSTAIKSPPSTPERPATPCTPSEAKPPSALKITEQSASPCAPSVVQPPSALETTEQPATPCTLPEVQPPSEYEMTERPATPCTPRGVQPPSALEGPWQTERVLDLERRHNLEQNRRRKAEKERDKLREALGRILSEDQIKALEKGSMRGGSWSQETLQKALHLKVACGKKGYEFVKENVVPLPGTRTLQNHMAHIKFRPGKFYSFNSEAHNVIAVFVQQHLCLCRDPGGGFCCPDGEGGYNGSRRETCLHYNG
ncbi:hypothetical protein V5799_026425 [Amblyomma americanum]|uniref:THAP-type domain-containing protein n=1 Tax=Amblyomma americanum TaxID=6943 RepID=A0AAQ4DIL8_AMBAM